MENWKKLLSTSSHTCASILEIVVLSRSTSSGSVTSHNVSSSPWNGVTTPTNDDYELCNRVDNYFASVCGLMWELTCHWPVETSKNFGEDKTGSSVNVPRRGKWILEMTDDMEMSVHVNLTVFSRGRSVSGEDDVRPSGP
jgi:hypothetical protein